MKQSLKVITATIFTGISFLLLPVAAHAVNVLPPVCNDSTSNTAGSSSPSVTPTTPDKNSVNNSQVCKDDLTNSTTNPIYGPDGILTKTVFFLSIIIAIVSIIVIIVAGIKFITSQGNPQIITTSRNQIIYAVVGLIVASLAQVIVNFVLRRL